MEDGYLRVGLEKKEKKEMNCRLTLPAEYAFAENL